jgi:hypothetical protein
MSHLEQLIAEFFDWQGYLVKRNVKVGRRPAGGWEMELDIVAFHPQLLRLVHIEASLDAHSWKRREERYRKKFTLGEKYILHNVFAWLPAETPIERIAIFPSVPATERDLAGARLQSIDDFVTQVADAVAQGKTMAKGAIPEQYPLLRTMQLTLLGYHRRPRQPVKAAATSTTALGESTQASADQVSLKC